MKEIDIKKQPRLAFSRIVQLTINGIRYRFFRSIVTMMVITVAIAFLMNSGTESFIKKAVWDYTNQEVSNRRLITKWVARLSQPGTSEELIATLSKLGPEDAYYRENLAFSNLSEADYEQFHSKLINAQIYLNFFNNMNYGNRRQLTHQAEETDIFNYLSEQENWNYFADRIAQMKNVKMVSMNESKDAMGDFKNFISSWPILNEQLKTLIQNRRQAIRALNSYLGDVKVLEAFVANKAEFYAKLKELGFILSQDEAAIIADQASILAAQRKLEKCLANTELRKDIAARMDLLPKDVNSIVLWNQILDDFDQASWFLEKAREHQALKDDSFKPMELVQVAEDKQYMDRLITANRKSLVKGAATSFMGLGERMSWLLMVSLLVCAVGIANAMLMTVTERFREIATLKCLGALDSFIMQLFVYEACFLGFCGGILGVILGLIIGIGRMTIQFGGIAWTAMAIDQLLLASVLAVFVGIILACVAAIYPSLKASRLAPMEAMRIE